MIVGQCDGSIDEDLGKYSGEMIVLIAIWLRELKACGEKWISSLSSSIDFVQAWHRRMNLNETGYLFGFRG